MAAPFSLYFLLFALFFKTHISLSIPNPRLDLSRPFSSITDVHDLLPVYGLPKGLLPNNVKSYSLSASGDFTIQLESPCYVQFDRLVYYEKEINGKLTYGAVRSVSGIQAKKLFLWVSVTDIELDKDSGMIEFFVGPLSEKLPVEQFKDIPACKRKACQETAVDSM